MDNKRSLLPPGWVPVPNRLFDVILPELSDTELRVLLVVFRSTLGWREGDHLGGWRYRERDWITHRQLIARTGRGSEAVSRAVEGLVQRRLIHVEDHRSQALSTPDARRRYLGRLYFRPGDMWITSEPDRPVKSNTTTYTRGNIKALKNTSRRPLRAPGRCYSGEGWQRAVSCAISPDAERS